MARPATGSPRWNATLSRWEARVTLVDGSRKPVAMSGIAPCTNGTPLKDAPLDCEHCSHARRRAQLLSDQARLLGFVPEETRELASEWFDRYHAYARELHQTDASKKRDRWRKWIAPKIGAKAMAAVTSEDIEDIRDSLDTAIAKWMRDGGKSAGKRGEAISGKTAMNVWSCLTSSFKAATSSKRRDLRVLDRKPNPCIGVLAPGDRSSRLARRKTFLYPREAAALLACADVPLEWREIYALALYTYLRPGELRVLTWADVDLEAGVFHVTKAWDYEDARIKPPKTRNGVRSVPIEAALAPLLERMRKAAEASRNDDRDDSPVIIPALAAFGEDHLAQKFRAHLTLAGVKRAELHASTLTHVQGNFRSCRDSGITWLAIRGLSVDKIMRRAGHDMVQTTMGYVKQAEDVAGELGVPFALLPEGLLGSGSGSGPATETTPETSLIQCRRRESKPCVERRDPSSAPESGAVDSTHVSPSDVTPEHAAETIPGPSIEATVLAETRRAEPEQPHVQDPSDSHDVLDSHVTPDDALRAAIKSAIDHGDLARASALLDVLKASPKPAPVLSIARPAKR